MDQQTQLYNLIQAELMGPATLIPNIVSRTWQSASFSLFSLSIYVSASRLLSSQSHWFVTSFSRCVFFPSVIFHTSSFLKGHYLIETPSPTPVFSEPLPSSFLTLLILQLFSLPCSLFYGES